MEKLKSKKKNQEEKALILRVFFGLKHGLLSCLYHGLFLCNHFVLQVALDLFCLPTVFSCIKETLWYYPFLFSCTWELHCPWPPFQRRSCSSSVASFTTKLVTLNPSPASTLDSLSGECHGQSPLSSSSPLLTSSTDMVTVQAATVVHPFLR